MNKLLSLALLCFCALTCSSQTFRFGVHSSPSHEAINFHGDLNGDGYEDLISNNFDSETSGFDVVLSKGDGSYRAPVFHTASPGGVIAVLIADLNGDGKLDVLARADDPNGFLIFFGKGDGTFRTPVSYHFTWIVGHLNWDIGTIKAADVNHDNKTDLILTTEDFGDTYAANLHMLLANGNGSFRDGPTIDDINGPENNGEVGLYTGDFDGDGKVDIALALGNDDGSGFYFRIRYGDGTGNFSQPYDVADLSPFYAIAADVNGDGKTDLVATNFIDPVEGGGGKEPYLTAFYGRSDRTMERVEITTTLGCSDGFPAVADFNGDHIPDIAFQENDCSGKVLAPNSVAILPGRGNNDFGPEQVVYRSPTQTVNPQALRANRDTKADIIFEAADNSSNGEYAHITLLNQTTGSFPTCAAPNAATGIALCSPVPGSTVSSPVDFAVGAAGDTPMRKAEVWSDGHKVAEQLAGAFSNYSFLDASVPLAAGSHHIVVYAAGWDNSLESRSYSLNVTASSCAAPSSPGVHVCSPANGSTVHSPVRLEAAGTVAGTLARMEVWVDGVKKYTAAKHLDTTISLSAGSHRFGFFAVNTNGQIWQTTVNAIVQ